MPDETPPPALSVEEARFWSKVRKDEDGCWLWGGSLTNGGYGRFAVGRRTVMAHRYSYERTVGPIPEGLQLDHLCRIRTCVRPGHLEAVTPRENTLRSEATSARNARKTHCQNGHPLAGDYLRAGELRNGHRVCLPCRTKRLTEWHAERRASGLTSACANGGHGQCKNRTREGKSPAAPHSPCKCQCHLPVTEASNA